MPFTCQVTALFEEPLTLALNCCVPKSATVATLGDTVTVTDPDAAVTVTVAVADFALLASEVAVTVTCAGFGTNAGAVYSPLAEIVPSAAPATLHVTAVFVVPETVAVNCWLLPTATLAVAGPTIMVIGFVLLPPPQPASNTHNTHGSN